MSAPSRVLPKDRPPRCRFCRGPVLGNHRCAWCGRVHLEAVEALVPAPPPAPVQASLFDDPGDAA